MSHRQHQGNKCIAVLCVSPHGVRRIVFRYHYWDTDDHSRQRAGTRSSQRRAEYALQGWATFTRLESVVP